MNSRQNLVIGIAQISPVWLDKSKTLEKVEDYILQAASNKCDLVTFGEGLVPGYPFWLSLTNGSEFESNVQKEIHAHYLQNAIVFELGDLDRICTAAKQNKMAIYLGTIERALDRGGHSLYCSLVYINRSGEIKSIHRKLQPTYEERLCWAPGDGQGLQTHQLESFTVGGLNCWENWMPLSRTALYAMGENLHIAAWPGSYRNTVDITRYIAKESRSFVISVSGMLKKGDINSKIPHYEKIISNCPDILANGGSCIARPTGEWLLKPVIDQEGLFCREIDISEVYRERQNFDPAGHYSRPDITKLIVNRDRQSIIEFD